MTTFAPVRAMARPSPVTVFTPVFGVAGTTSWPSSRRHWEGKRLVRSGQDVARTSPFERGSAIDTKKRARLKLTGYTVGDAADFLGLSETERVVVEMRVSLGRRLREKRLEAHLTQSAVAKRLHCSPSRVAKTEAGDRTVSLDLLIQGLLEVGADRKEVAKVLAGAV